LYEIDSLSGEIVRTVSILNAELHDWEDLAIDDEYFYIADSGNDDGSRQDLKIYRITQSDYLGSDSATAEVISYNFAAQTDFSPQEFNTDYDIEAMIAVGDSLYLFSKNWTDQTCDIYVLPSSPGSYALEPLSSFDSEGFVTGAHYDVPSQEVSLVGYAFSGAFVSTINGFDLSSPIEVSRNSLSAPAGYSVQVEAICQAPGAGYFISSESGFAGDAGLFRLHDIVNGIDNSWLRIIHPPYPNPCSTELQLDLLDGEHYVISDAAGRVVYKGIGAIAEFNLKPGQYHVSIFNSAQRLIGSSSIMVQ